MGGALSAALPLAALWLSLAAPPAPREAPEAQPEVEEAPVRVIARRRRPGTGSTTRLTPRDIQAAPHRNAEEILRQVPGLTLVQHGSEGKGHQFFLRGFDAMHGADLELSVEGIPLNEWSNVHAQGYLDLGVIIPELVEGVDVVKGPFTLEQGTFAMAGSAAYRLGVGEEARGGRVAYTLGTTGRHRALATWSPCEGEGATFLGAEVTRDEGFGQRRALRRVTLNGRARLHALGGEIQLLGLGGGADFELPTPLRNDDVAAGRVGFYDAYDHDLEGQSARGLWSLRYARRGGGASLRVLGHGGYRRLRLLENFTGDLIHPGQGDRRLQRHEAWSFGLGGAREARLTRRLKLDLGAGTRGEIFAQDEAWIGPRLETLEARRDLEGIQALTHGRAGLIWSPNRALRARGGLRVDWAHVRVTDRLAGDAEGAGSLITASPRATARWRLAPTLRLTAAYGRGLRPPEARAFSSFEADRVGIAEEAARGGPAMTTSDAFELGGRWSPAAWLSLSLSGFATFIERESIFDHVSGVNLEMNRTRRVGGELVLDSNPRPWLSLGADVTVVDARFVGSGARVPLAPWLASGGRVSVERGALRAGLRLLAIAPRPLPHGATGATLIMTDATLGYRWGPAWVGLEVENLLDRALREGEYHYASHWREGTPASEIPALHTTAGGPLEARLTLGLGSL